MCECSLREGARCVVWKHDWIDISHYIFGTLLQSYFYFFIYHVMFFSFFLGLINFHIIILFRANGLFP